MSWVGMGEGGGGRCLRARRRSAHSGSTACCWRAGTPIESERQARTLEELIHIRAFHGDKLRRYSLGTALGFRTRHGMLTDQPAIIVFVARKVHEQWLMASQKLPNRLKDPNGLWCDVDVVEFSYHNASGAVASQPVHNMLVEGLRGNFPRIGPGSQIASEEMYGTLGLIARSKIENRPLGFLTNHHVAVNFDQPRQLIYHPLPPPMGRGCTWGRWTGPARSLQTSFGTAYSPAADQVSRATPLATSCYLLLPLATSCSPSPPHSYFGTTGTLQVLYRYSTGSLQVLYRYSTGTLQVLYRYSTGTLLCSLQWIETYCLYCSLLYSLMRRDVCARGSRLHPVRSGLDLEKVTRVVLFCTVLFHTVLYCTALLSTVLFDAQRRLCAWMGPSSRSARGWTWRR